MTRQSKLPGFILRKQSRKRENSEVNWEKGPYRLPKDWKWTKIGNVTHINKETRNPTKKVPDEKFIYIDISGVKKGRIEQTKKILGRDAPSRARRVIHTNDVIMSTVRPYLKSFAIIPKRYNNQICSTGFAVLSSKGSLLPKCLLYTLLSDTTIQQCNTMMVGAHYPALRMEQVSQIKIPLPPLEEQRRIVKRIGGFISKIEESRKLKRISMERSERIMQAALHKLFLKTEEKDWECAKLSDVSVIVDREHRTPTYEKCEGGIPIISPTNFIGLDDIDFSQVRKVTLEEYKRDCKRLKIEVGDVLYSRIGTIGKARSVQDTKRFTILHSIVLIKPKKKMADSRFIRWVLESDLIKQQAYEGTKSIGTPDLGIKIIRNFEIPHPSLEEQKNIAAYLDSLSKFIGTLKKLQQETKEELKKLSSAVLDKAFKNKL